MLPRDIDTESYLRRFYPKTDIMTFQRDMYAPDKNMMHVVAFEKADVDEAVENSTKLMYATTATAVTSFIFGVVLFNKLPLFSRIQSKWGRFFSKVFLFVTPVYLTMGYNIYKQNVSLETAYQKYFERYVKYKCTGNALDLNPNIERKQLLFLNY